MSHPAGSLLRHLCHALSPWIARAGFDTNMSSALFLHLSALPFLPPFIKVRHPLFLRLVRVQTWQASQEHKMVFMFLHLSKSVKVIGKILLIPSILLPALQDSDGCWSAGACLMLLIASENELLFSCFLLTIYDLKSFESHLTC